jgi:hypothetical protein
MGNARSSKLERRPVAEAAAVRRGAAAEPVARALGLPSDQRGAAAVEMALVLPFALMLLLGIMQFGGLLFLQNTMTQVANDVVRRVAVGDLSETDAVTEVETRLADWSATFTVVVDTPTASDVRVAVSVPMADAALIDVGHWMGSGNLSAEATMRVE